MNLQQAYEAAEKRYKAAADTANMAETVVRAVVKALGTAHILKAGAAVTAQAAARAADAAYVKLTEAGLAEN